MKRYLQTLLFVLSHSVSVHAVELESTAQSSESPSADTFEAKLAEAEGSYSGEGLGMRALANGEVEIRCDFQDLKARLDSEGLWLHSSAEDGARFRVCAQAIGTTLGEDLMRLEEQGRVVLEGDQVARWRRAGLTEEFRVSMGGVRQDFLVPERPTGAGDLRVVLAIDGATLRESAPGNGVILTLDQGGREIAYSQLHVTDAMGRELTAWMEIDAENQLSLIVADADAVYPVRIDPTFTDADWVSINAAVPGTDGIVYATVIDAGGQLYIGGDFRLAGSVAADHLARWDGSDWYPVGSGINGTVYALAVSGSQLYAGGSFTQAGGQSANYIAKWDGSNWSALGQGLNNTVRVLANSGGDVYVGGLFTQAGGQSANYIAKWDGSNWSVLGSGMDNNVRALLVSGSDVYAGGLFEQAGGQSANRVARWDGSSWSALGAGTNGGVYALADLGGEIYAGGYFTEAGGQSANNIAKWDGSAWSALGSGVNSSVFALAELGGDILVGGGLRRAGGQSANRIAKWDGTNWSALGSGMNNTVFALVVSGNELFAGGWFTEAGGATTNRIGSRNGMGAVGPRWGQG